MSRQKRDWGKWKQIQILRRMVGLQHGLKSKRKKSHLTLVGETK